MAGDVNTNLSETQPKQICMCVRQEINSLNIMPHYHISISLPKHGLLVTLGK